MPGKSVSQEIDLLWSDESILVVNKPPGLLVVPGGGQEADEPDLHSLLEAEFGRVWTVHRLDRDTSGVVVFARTAEAHQILNDQFERRETVKVYHALVEGQPIWRETSVRLGLVVDGDRRHRTTVDNRFGKPAVTDLRLEEIFRGVTLVAALPHTGYTHQIRVHLAAVGFPVVGDPLYGTGRPLLLSTVKPKFKSSGPEERPLVDRTALHARMLTFNHPVSGAPHTYEAPYPKDLAIALKQLRRWG